MSFTLDKVVPWGRSFEEYVAMFALTPADLNRLILGCGDGPSSFNSVLTRRGGKVISVDPLYSYSKAEIKQRVDEIYHEVIEQTHKNQHEFVWDIIGSVEELGKIRMSAMQEFLNDYEKGLVEGRYLSASLPTLPFKERQFELALCSHFLFLYSDQMGLDFHLDSIRELCRIADDIRIFPLLKLGTEPSPFVEPIMQDVRQRGYRAEIVKVGYEFQRGGNKMLKIDRV